MSCKPCSKCGVVKPLDEFHVHKQSRDQRRPDCKSCHKSAGRRRYVELDYRAKNSTEENRRKVFFREIRYKYGMSEEQYLGLLRQQEGLCAICKKPESRPMKGKTMKLSVDHCHETGIVRGILCGSCNTAVGLFNDDPGLIRTAIRYLNRNQDG